MGGGIAIVVDIGFEQDAADAVDAVDLAQHFVIIRNPRGVVSHVIIENVQGRSDV